MRRSTRASWAGIAATGALVSLAATVGAGGDARPVDVSHLTGRTIVDAGRTRVIAFRVDPPPAADQVLPVQLSDSTVLEIAREPVVLEGESIGYVRVRGISPGETVLTVGDSALPIRVVEPRGPDRGADLDPEIIGPSTGAVVWGTIAIGVEVRQQPRAPLREVHVRLSDGEVLEPVSDTQRRHQPYRHVAFELDTAKLPPGPLDLIAVALDQDGREYPGRAVRVTVAPPAPADITAGEAEFPYEVERPQRFRDARMSVGNHRDASGGRYFLNAAANPAVCFPVTVDEPGWYQVMLTAAGTYAQGALPTVGIVVDGGNMSTTNGRLIGKRWHRFAAGVPFPLEPGTHIITPFFANDFWVPNLADRNLYLDRIEVARIVDARAAQPPDENRDQAMVTDRPGGMMAAARTGPLGAVAVDDPYGTSAAPLRIGFVRPLHGQILPGTFEVEGRVWWDGAGHVPAPLVTLMVNDRPVGAQRSGAPRFWVDPSHFAAGANRIQLVAALDSGATASTPVQTMEWPAAAAHDVAKRPPRHHRRFSIHDDRWEPGIKALLRSEHHPKERQAAAFFSEGSASLNLPEVLAGTFNVFLHLRGDHFEGAPIATVSLRCGDQTELVGTAEAPTWWDTRLVGGVGKVELPPGPKQLVIAFENDRFEPGQGDRNLWLQAVLLAQEPVVEDRIAPVIEIVYPPERHPVYMVDALVAEAADNASLASAELILDGMATGMGANLNVKPGRFVFPLLLRSAAPGEHTVAVRVNDVAGNVSLSEPRTIVVRGEPPDEPSPYDRAIRLLNRFAYGPDVHELAAILTKGDKTWLADRLSQSLDEPGDLAALGSTYLYFVNRSVYETPRRTIAHLLTTPNPARARFVLWAENHFSTWIRKTGGNRKWDEHVVFSRLGTAPFDQLLLASAQSPAMLNYLDQERSFAGRINENYAREIMELHTLGVDGGYSQTDVTNLAGLLTGWTASFEGDGRGGGPGAQRYTFRFDPRLSDGGATRVLGLALPAATPRERYDRVYLTLEVLSNHPSTARFVSRSLAEHYVRTPVPDGLIDDLAQVFLETGGDMRAMLRAIAEHPEFWSAESAERIAPPLDYAVRLGRVTGHFQPWQVGDYLQRSGHGLFDHPAPDGYPQEDSAYTDSNALVQRWRFAREMVGQLAGLVPGRWRYGGALAEGEWAQRVIDVIAVRLTGRLLGESSNQAALELLTASAGTRDERVRLIGPFIAQLPEASLK